MSEVADDAWEVVCRIREFIVPTYWKKMTRWFHLLEMSTNWIVGVPFPI